MKMPDKTRSSVPPVGGAIAAALLAFLALTAVSCTKAKNSGSSTQSGKPSTSKETLGADKTFVYLGGPFTEGNYLDACESEDESLATAYSQHWVNFELRDIPTGVPVFFAGGGGVTSPVLLYNPETNTKFTLRKTDSFAVICHKSKTYADQRKKNPKKPKLNWEAVRDSLQETGHSKREIAIVGGGTRQEAIATCGLDFLPTVRDPTVAEELSFRSADAARTLAGMKDLNARAAAAEKIEGSLEHKALSFGFWMYMQQATPGSKVPWVRGGKSDSGGDNDRFTIICYNPGSDRKIIYDKAVAMKFRKFDVKQVDLGIDDLWASDTSSDGCGALVDSAFLPENILASHPSCKLHKRDEKRGIILVDCLATQSKNFIAFGKGEALCEAALQEARNIVSQRIEKAH